jgi:hypothetical protein
MRGCYRRNTKIALALRSMRGLDFAPQGVRGGENRGTQSRPQLGTLASLSLTQGFLKHIGSSFPSYK